MSESLSTVRLAAKTGSRWARHRWVVVPQVDDGVILNGARVKEGRKARNREKQAYQTLLSGPLGCVPKIVEDQTRKTSSRLWRGVVIALRRQRWESREGKKGENEADRRPAGCSFRWECLFRFVVWSRVCGFRLSPRREGRRLCWRCGRERWREKKSPIGWLISNRLVAGWLLLLLCWVRERRRWNN